MPKAAIFDVDGTLLDSVDLHALAWHEAMVKFGHDVGFEQARSQIGKGGDKLIPHFLSAEAQQDHGRELKEWRGKRFKSAYLPLVRPFSAVPDLLRRVRDAGLRIAVASSAKKDELDKYLATAGIADLVDVTTSSDDVEESKPSPDIFEVALKKLDTAAGDAIAIGDTPYDAEAAGKAGIPTIGVLSGGFTEVSLRQAGCVQVYAGPAALLACFGDTLLARWVATPLPGREVASSAPSGTAGVRLVLRNTLSVPAPQHLWTRLGQRSSQPIPLAAELSSILCSSASADAVEIPAFWSCTISFRWRPTCTHMRSISALV